MVTRFFTKPNGSSPRDPTLARLQKVNLSYSCSKFFPNPIITHKMCDRPDQQALAPRCRMAAILEVLQVRSGGLKWHNHPTEYHDIKNYVKETKREALKAIYLRKAT